MQRVDGVFGGNADVFGDRPSGCRTCQECESPDTAPLVHPLSDQFVGQPAAPIELYATFDLQVVAVIAMLAMKIKMISPIWVNRPDIER